MNWDALIVCLLVGLAVGWLGRRWYAVFRRGKEGGCAGGCGCASKLQPKK
jgi:hypothetical protein